ncbi:large ribosomal subunit protein mL52 isoform X2 [Calonectris borealis]|uniref:large ribosomal subunit protein mL52 isoform X2 n=1 Tax=Calonectris borealis TaxID=1323832 RepID=UPI003F4B9A63
MAAPRAEAAGLAAGRHRPAVTWGSVASLPAAGMAARRIMRLAERHARSLRPLPRPAQRIGQWQGLAPSTAGYGPLRDPPDWAFADGRPAPLWKGQQRRLRESEELARRAVTLSRALEAAAGGGERGAAPSPRLRPKGSQRRPVRTSTDQ